MKWISTEDMLPDPSQILPLYVVNTANGIGFADYDGAFGFSNVIIGTEVQSPTLAVTHWIELPAIPKV
ncbi:DUF551 domain-containing protein [Pantoea agglomerans]|uniref:DUF551 domain-containing protein n=1 Tax=Enterobacter agglomerans TaxID=549 RepID=UPI003AF1F8A1